MLNTNKFPKKIFLLRKNASKRRNFNEDEVFSALKKYGFIGIFPEEYSISDQVTIFHQAEIIAGGSGAAMTNIICCTSSCKVMIFAKDEKPYSAFSTIAKIFGIKLIYITEQHNNNKKIKNLHEPFEINIRILNETILNWS